MGVWSAQDQQAKNILEDSGPEQDKDAQHDIDVSQKAHSPPEGCFLDFNRVNHPGICGRFELFYGQAANFSGHFGCKDPENADRADKAQLQKPEGLIGVLVGEHHILEGDKSVKNDEGSSDDQKSHADPEDRKVEL